MSDETIQKPFEIGEKDTHLIQIKKNKDHKLLFNTKMCRSAIVCTLGKIKQKNWVISTFKIRYTKWFLIYFKSESLE